MYTDVCDVLPRKFVVNVGGSNVKLMLILNW